MVPDTHLLSGPTTLATCNPDISLTAKTLLSSSFIFLHVSSDNSNNNRQNNNNKPPEQRMSTRPRSSTNDETELWFSMPSSRRRQEQSAYQTTVSRHHATRSASANELPGVQGGLSAGRISTISTISTNSGAQAFPAGPVAPVTPVAQPASLAPIPSPQTSPRRVPMISASEVDKPLPPSPEQRKKHKPGLLNLIRKRPSNNNLDPTHLQPHYNSHKRTSSNDNLSPASIPDGSYSRSMPSSPLNYSPPQPADMQRARSAASHYVDTPQYQPYTPPRPQLSDQQRAASLGTYFDPAPRPRRSNPVQSGSSTVTARETVSDAPRPHTWMSPTEPFDDASDFHLFAEATACLPGGFDPLSPTESPRLQSSLFASTMSNNRVPLLERIPSAPPAPLLETPQYEWTPPRQTRDYSVSSSALPSQNPYSDDQSPVSPRLPNLNAINLELERLGLVENETPPDDELPDYAQSQAEMAAQRRKEASARARELESRWNVARGGWRHR